eukprot:TRINITY_DN121_c0_g1_i11.p1 TRINITY_DN121_c0_g1~~TRINITY_DN121_c0_g1_i11.p1  ORF type:complete len:264 (+),score=24.18 TRINITY_DN121_c0_g1_i11:82-873(+)
MASGRDGDGVEDNAGGMVTMHSDGPLSRLTTPSADLVTNFSSSNNTPRWLAPTASPTPTVDASGQRNVAHKVLINKKSSSKCPNIAQFMFIHVFLLSGSCAIPSHPLNISFVHNQPQVYLIYLILLILGICLFFKTLLTSPGFVQKQKQCTSSSPSPSGMITESPGSSGDGNNQVLVTVNERVCSDCNMIRSPRSRHCHHCGGCVVKFDHHCPFFGICIGGRNHRFFYWFLVVETAVMCWTGSMVNAPFIWSILLFSFGRLFC